MMFRQKKKKGKKEKEKEPHVPGGPCKQKRENQTERKKSREIEREAVGVVVK